jgi:hypothetical protein
VGRHEFVIEAAQQRLVLVEAVVAIDPGQLLAVGLLLHAVQAFSAACTAQQRNRVEVTC